MRNHAASQTSLAEIEKETGRRQEEPPEIESPRKRVKDQPDQPVCELYELQPCVCGMEPESTPTQEATSGPAPAGLRYRVERDVYSEAQLDSEVLHRREHAPKSLCQRVNKHVRCSPERLKAAVQSLLPIVTWLPAYPVKDYLFGDLVSGLSTGVMQLPQGHSLSLKLWYVGYISLIKTPT
ncbi:hypothetical protein AALO_G00218520 [Alosa alosa]|uniref:Uncharacterized protein n=1 Tax=Alosa alosa TaxID=278164 RepID=A0AAV6FX69_9TELE|nr:hypothetical protein AALO_G00218520 [Alosa alosa]